LQIRIDSVSAEREDCTMHLDTKTGMLDQAYFHPSPNFDQRESGAVPQAVIIHCISLPPGEYGGSEVLDFFANKLNSHAHPYFLEICDLKVSAHFFIRRDGQLIQLVSTKQRAWHAGESMCLGQSGVNNFSIGVELEGLDSDTDGYTDPQYFKLNELLDSLTESYPDIDASNIFAHSDIAPGRKPDPGAYFNWSRIT